MELQIRVKSPPGKASLDHPQEVLEALIGQEFVVATNSELIKCDRKDLLDSGFAVNINQVALLFERLGKTSLANYWRQYLVKHPSSIFLLFYDAGDEVELIY